MYGIDIGALRWAIGIFIFFVVAWFILARKLLKGEPKVIKVNLADRYKDIDLKEYGITSSDFKEMAFNKFIFVQMAFAKGDLETLKKYLTIDLYDYYKEQIDIISDKGLKNITDNFELRHIKIFDVVNEHNMLRIKVYLNVRMIDYIINVKNGKCVKGNKDELVDFEFELYFEKNNSEDALDKQFLMSYKSCVNDMLIKESERKDK